MASAEVDFRVLNVHSLQYQQCAVPCLAHSRGHGRGRYFQSPQPGVRTGRASREPNVAGAMAGGDPRSAGSSHTCEVPLAPCRDRFLQDKIMTVAGGCTSMLPVEVVPSGWLLARGVASRVSRLVCARGRGHCRESGRPQAGTQNLDFTSPPRAPRSHGQRGFWIASVWWG